MNTTSLTTHTHLLVRLSPPFPTYFSLYGVFAFIHLFSQCNKINILGYGDVVPPENGGGARNILERSTYFDNKHGEVYLLFECLP